MGVYCGAQGPNPFSVNDANPKDSPFQAFLKIVIEKSRQFARSKRVQIEFSRDGDCDWID